MGFSGIGIWEIIIILVVVIIILGPHRIPEIGRTLGKAFRAIKKASSDISLNISKELEEPKTTKPSPPANPASAATPATSAPAITIKKPPATSTKRTPAKEKPATPPEGPPPQDE
jgi:sec-independent protein translocase protein TatA